MSLFLWCLCRSFAGEALERERFASHVSESYQAGMSFAGAKANLESLNRHAAQPRCAMHCCTMCPPAGCAPDHCRLEHPANNHSAVYFTGQARSSAHAAFLPVHIVSQRRRQAALGSWHLGMLALCALGAVCPHGCCSLADPTSRGCGPCRGAVHLSLLALYALGGFLVSQGLMPIRILLSAIGFTFSLVFATQGLVQTLSDVRRVSGSLDRWGLAFEDSCLPKSPVCPQADASSTRWDPATAKPPPHQTAASASARPRPAVSLE